MAGNASVKQLYKLKLIRADTNRKSCILYPGTFLPYFCLFYIIYILPNLLYRQCAREPIFCYSISHANLFRLIPIPNEVLTILWDHCTRRVNRSFVEG